MYIQLFHYLSIPKHANLLFSPTQQPFFFYSRVWLASGSTAWLLHLLLKTNLVNILEHISYHSNVWGQWDRIILYSEKNAFNLSKGTVNKCITVQKMYISISSRLTTTVPLVLPLVMGEECQCFLTGEPEWEVAEEHCCFAGFKAIGGERVPGK